MMTFFYEASALAQTALLVTSLGTVVVLCCYFSLTFRRNYRASQKYLAGSVLIGIAMLYVLLQLDSRIAGSAPILQWPIPYGAVLIVTLLCLGYALWASLGNTESRSAVNNTSIKEAFDNLPTGVCFFNEKGLPILCNHAMHSFSFAVTGKDVQYITDSELCLQEDFRPAEGVVKEGKLFLLPDRRVFQLDKRTIPDADGSIFTQFLATEVTELYQSRLELERETQRLRRVQHALRKLSANVVTATREEEILNTKMLVHDEMGRCLVEARKYLQEDSRDMIPPQMVKSWQRAVAMLKYNNEMQEEDMLSQVVKTCESLQVNFVQTGELPAEEGKAYLLICAVRECLTNAVRYAGAGELYAEFTETASSVSVSVTNDGTQPSRPIVEGGGLSTLRRRVEREGGTMTVESLPRIRVTVSLPKRKEELL